MDWKDKRKVKAHKALVGRNRKARADFHEKCEKATKEVLKDHPEYGNDADQIPLSVLMRELNKANIR